MRKKGLGPLINGGEILQHSAYIDMMGTKIFVGIEGPQGVPMGPKIKFFSVFKSWKMTIFWAKIGLIWPPVGQMGWIFDIVPGQVLGNFWDIDQFDRRTFINKGRAKNWAEVGPKMAQMGPKVIFHGKLSGGGQSRKIRNLQMIAIKN